MIVRFSGPPPNNFRQLLHFPVSRHNIFYENPRTKLILNDLKPKWNYFYFVKSLDKKNLVTFFSQNLACSFCHLRTPNGNRSISFPLITMICALSDFKHLSVDKVSSDIFELDGSLMYYCNIIPEQGWGVCLQCNCKCWNNGSYSIAHRVYGACLWW